MNKLRKKQRRSTNNSTNKADGAVGHSLPMGIGGISIAPCSSSPPQRTTHGVLHLSTQSRLATSHNSEANQGLHDPSRRQICPNTDSHKGNITKAFSISLVSLCLSLALLSHNHTTDTSQQQRNCHG